MKKTNLVLDLMLVMLLVMSTGLMAFAGGDGSSGDPYQVSNAAELNDVRNNLSSYFIQTENIDLNVNPYNTGSGWEPIGDNTNSFSGNYNGDDYNISNLFIDRGTENYVGFWGYLNNASISNVTLVNLSIAGALYVGGLVGVGHGNTSISGCEINGTIIGTAYIGGCIGINNSAFNITTTHFSGTITADNSDANIGAGGFAGEKQGTGVISDCSSTGTITGNGRNQGGFVAWLDNGSIERCYSTMNVINTSTNQGRIAGFAGAIAYYGGTSGSVYNCYATGNVTTSSTNSSNYGVGGFVGTFYAAGTNKAYYSYSTGAVSAINAINYVGGFSGEDHSGGTGGTGNFWDTESSGWNTSSEQGTGETAKTTEQMKTQSTFTDAGWNFTTIWEIISFNYPRLIDNHDQALPVTLSSFNAAYINLASTLSWTTQSESSNLGWNVYCGENDNFDAVTVLNADIIEGSGTTSTPTDYEFIDPYSVNSGADYWFWLESISFSGDCEIFGPVMLTVPNTNPDQNTPIVPETFGLYQNYPNPFNPSTQISFALEEAGKAELIIYDIKGRKVKTLFRGSIAEKQIKSFVWSGKDDADKQVSSGLYFYKMKASKYSEVRKMILMK